jgi:hypothetical protein
MLYMFTWCRTCVKTKIKGSVNWKIIVVYANPCSLGTR